MGDEPTGSSKGNETPFTLQVGTKATRKIRVLKRKQRGVWFGLGMSGLIGWSVAVPTLAGSMLGLWWDRRHPGSRSWTLALLAAGLAIGCTNAWHWIMQESKAMQDESKDGDE
jgi:ATP synthase protein I